AFLLHFRWRRSGLGRRRCGLRCGERGRAENQGGDTGGNEITVAHGILLRGWVTLPTPWSGRCSGREGSAPSASSLSLRNDVRARSKGTACFRCAVWGSRRDDRRRNRPVDD